MKKIRPKGALRLTKDYKQMLKMRKSLPDCCYIGYYKLLGIENR